MPHLLHSADEI